MTLFVPILLFGLIQPSDQPDLQSPAQPEAQSQDPGAVAAQRNLKIPSRSKVLQSDYNRSVCYTMRSYIFEREDDLAPELVGMTTCDPGRAITQKRVRRIPKLVPSR